MSDDLGELTQNLIILFYDCDKETEIIRGADEVWCAWSEYGHKYEAKQ